MGATIAFCTPERARNDRTAFLALAFTLVGIVVAGICFYGLSQVQ
jgi:hypothetical protein